MARYLVPLLAKGYGGGGHGHIHSVFFWQREGVVVIISIHIPSFFLEREGVKVIMVRYPLPLPKKGMGGFL